MNRIDRLLGYLLLFQSRGLLRAQDFAATFEISERTVYRDIQALCEVGVPIAAMPGEGYRLMEGYYLPPIMFSGPEARALFLAVSMLTGFTEPGSTRAAAETALEKIRAVLPEATLEEVEALREILGFHAVNRPLLTLDDEKFVRLQQAIYRRRVVHLHYHALHSNEPTERDVEPHYLGFVDQAWILNAYCRLRQDQRNFRLDRIDRLQLTSETFTPRQMAIRSYPHGDWRVMVRFEPEAVRWVHERQHFGLIEEQVAVEMGGSIMVYQVESFTQILPWLLSWGDQVEVIDPPELRTELARIAAHSLARHQSKNLPDL